MKLTAANIPTLPEGQYTDSAHPGLNILVGKKRKTWYLRHRVGGTQRQDKLGYFPVLGLADARKAAAALAERIDSGAPSPRPPAHPRNDAFTLGALIDKYEKQRRLRGGRVRSLQDAMKAVRRGLADYAGLPARDFKKADLRAARDKVAAGRGLSASNQLLACASPMLRWAAAEDLIEHDFSREVLRLGAETARERTLDTDEIKAVWLAAGEAGNFGGLVRFLLLTGCRRTEGATLRHGDIRGGTWYQNENKSDRPQTLKLPEDVLEIVGKGDADNFVFAGRGGAQLSGYSKAKTALDTASGTSGWRLHDLRRTAASGMQDLGINPAVVHGVLNHALGGLGAIYMRGEMLELKAAALERWSDRVGAVVKGTNGLRLVS